MRTLIAEDDYISRRILQEILAQYGEPDVVEDGEEALKLFKKAFNENRPYNLVCLDIMMPNMDGRDTLRNLRNFEESNDIAGMDRVKVIMTTALDDTKNIMGSFTDQCDAYLVKPIKKDNFTIQLKELELI